MAECRQNERLWGEALLGVVKTATIDPRVVL